MPRLVHVPEEVPEEVKNINTPQRVAVPCHPLQHRKATIMNVIKTTEAPAAIGPDSQAIAEGAFLFTSGQLPIDPATGDLRNSDIETAARQVLSNLRAVLVAGGADTSTVLKTTVFLSDICNFQAFNAVYAEFFQEPFPARSCVQVGALPKGALVEIEAVAVRKTSQLLT